MKEPIKDRETAIAHARVLENKMAVYREKICDMTDEIEELNLQLECTQATIKYLSRVLDELAEEKEKVVHQIYNEGKENV